MQLSREGASIVSSVQKHLSFLDSPAIARCVASSTFDVQDLGKRGRGLSIFCQVSSDQLQAQRGWLRLITGTMIRSILNTGDERKSEVLLLLDEFSALAGNNFTAVEEALVRGRSAGLRMVIACQSDSQVKAAFKDKPTLLHDNCSTQIYFGVNSIETAERLSKSLGEFTQVVESASNSDTLNRQEPGPGNPYGSRQTSKGWNLSWQPQGRALMRPDEILTMSNDRMIVLISGMPPILARRIKYFADRVFPTARNRIRNLLWWLVLSGATAAIVLAVFRG